MKTLIKVLTILMMVAFVTVGCEKKAEKPADTPKAEDPAKKDGDKPVAEKKDDKAPADEKKDDKAPAADEKKAADGATTCATLSTKVITLLKVQGDKAMLKEKDIPMLTKGCEKGKTLETNKEDVECVMKAADLKAMGECKGSNKMLKDMMKNAG